MSRFNHTYTRKLKTSLESYYCIFLVFISFINSMISFPSPFTFYYCKAFSTTLIRTKSYNTIATSSSIYKSWNDDANNPTSTKRFNNKNMISSSTLPLYYNKRFIRIPPMFSQNNSQDCNTTPERKSVTGIIYTSDENDDNPSPIVVQLYTKEGCTLCDKVSEVLQSLRSEYPHTLEAIDITDPDKIHIYDKYKYDIPVLHINNVYWTKHKLSKTDAVVAFCQVQDGTFVEAIGDPDAGAMERRQMERKQEG